MSRLKNILEPYLSESHSYRYGLPINFITIMFFLSIIGLSLSLFVCQQPRPKPIASEGNSRYYINLFKKHASGKPSRYSLAFFVPDNSVDSQIHSKYSSTAQKVHLSTTRVQSLIFMAAPQCLPTDYEGKTSLNKIAVRRISGAVACVTESDSSHPIFIYSVIPTQKTAQGGYYHA
ncbi:hypothetical protein ES754_10365 [Psychrobacter frigidicola]|uniref:Uncharacterized protein n=1 Tax=Psychrobacter frigidicola TaxID=45611 RepID=A0A5C7A120_9GAMM|nr:hypothetical protein [Psychrobacter frigidicola]TXD96532.1 hypothetical protein ES754_10365 [Psychrobacter frigidicola]